MKNNHKTLNRRVFTLLLAILSLLATQNVTATHAEIGGNDPTKDQMLAFMANYPENGTSNYNYFINRLNKLLKEKSTTEIKTLSKTVQGDINYRYTAPGVTDAERANIKAIAKQLNNTYGWNLVMPKKPTTPDPDASFDYKAQGLTKEQWDDLSPQMKEAVARSAGFDPSQVGQDIDVRIEQKQQKADSLQREIDKRKHQ